MTGDSDQLEFLRQELAEAHATLDAIRRGEVDAIVVGSGEDQEVYSLEPADLPYRDFIERMAEGAAALDEQLTVLYVNLFLCRLVGRPRAELIGSSFVPLLDEAAKAEFLEACASGESCKISASLRVASGKLVPVSLAITPYGPERRPRINLVVSDLSAHRRLTTVKRDRDRAKAESTAKDRFLAVLGHELRNPLAALTSSVALLQETPVEDQQRDWILSSMARQLRQLRSLVDDLLDATRIARGKIVLKKERVRLATLLTATLEAMSEPLAARCHTVDLGPVPESLELVADPTRLEQIVVNLLLNAVKYTPPGGAIDIAVDVEPELVRIAIADNGQGLEAAMTEQIFEPFEQVVAQDSSGLGIGLTLVRQLVELHGGQVWAESPGLGRGSTFFVELPRIADDVGETAAPRDAPLGASGLELLIIDDNVDSTDLLQIWFESKQARVHVLNQGHGAVEAVARVDPSVILLDLGLPDVSGIDVCRAIRAAGHTRVVIFAMTGFSHAEVREQVRAAGFDEHLVKPITVDQILAMLASYRARIG